MKNLKLMLLSLILFLLMTGLTTYFAWLFDNALTDAKANFCMAWIACIMVDKLMEMKK